MVKSSGQKYSHGNILLKLNRACYDRALGLKMLERMGCNLGLKTRGQIQTTIYGFLITSNIILPPQQAKENPGF